MPVDVSPVVRHEVELPVRTIARALAAVGLVVAAVKLWPTLMLILFSLLIAVALSPALGWLESRRVPRGYAVLIIGVVLVALFAGSVLLVLPRLSEELSLLVQSLPEHARNVQRQLPGGHPLLQKLVAQVFELPASPEAGELLARPLVWGPAAIKGLTSFVLLVVLSLYLLFDGRRLYAWLLAYVPRRHRPKMADTATEVERVVTAYVLGQLLTSALCAVFSFTVLAALGVPAAVPLALLAGACDVLPVVGLVISTIPAVLLALTVSPSTAVLVLAAFLAYHAFESYVLVPLVYGKTLRLSTLSVLLALIVGASLQGVAGAILILPLVAAYPVIERIWLRDYLGHEVVREHGALAEAAANGSDHAVDAMLRGDGPPRGPLAADTRR